MKIKMLALLSIVAIALLAGCSSQDGNKTSADLEKEKLKDLLVGKEILFAFEDGPNSIRMEFGNNGVLKTTEFTRNGNTENLHGVWEAKGDGFVGSTRRQGQLMLIYEIIHDGDELKMVHVAKRIESGTVVNSNSATAKVSDLRTITN